MITTICMNPSFDKTMRCSGFSVGEVNRPDDIRMDPGGKGINVSRVLQRLGTPSRCIACVGTRNGDALRSLLAAEGLTLCAFPLPGDVRTNLKLVDEQAGLVTEINEPGPCMDVSAQAHFLSFAAEASADSEYILMSGSALPQCGKDWYARVAHALPGKKYVVDCTGDALLSALAEKPFLIKPNLSELRQLTDLHAENPAFVQLAAEQLMQKGACNVIVSMGADGAYLFTQEGTYYTAPVPVPVHSTVGAGDSMLAGVLHGLSQGMTLKDAFACGAAAGTAAVTTKGTDLFDRAVYNDILGKVRVQTM